MKKVTQVAYVQNVMIDLVMWPWPPPTRSTAPSLLHASPPSLDLYLLYYLHINNYLHRLAVQNSSSFLTAYILLSARLAVHQNNKRCTSCHLSTSGRLVIRLCISASGGSSLPSLPACSVLSWKCWPLSLQPKSSYFWTKIMFVSPHEPG